MSAFRDLSPQTQKLRLRREAFEVLRAYPIEVRQVRCLNHGFNTTFRVEATDGTLYALRLNASTHRRPENVRGELAWLSALASETDLRLPRPVARKDGALLSFFPSAAMGRELMAVLFHWLPGPTLSLASPPEHFRGVGEIMAKLHRQAEHWQPPADVAFPDARRVGMGWPDQIECSHLTDAEKAVYAEATLVAQASLDALSCRQPNHVLHGDLHPWNLKRCRGRMYVFDFDDSSIGTPGLDVAITSFYLRRAPQGEAMEEAFRAGYSGVHPWPDTTATELEALLASRQIFLSNDLVAIENSEIRNELAGYLAKGVSRLRAFLATGRFPRLDPPA